MDYDEIVRRLSIIRNRSNLSARELSLRINKNSTYIGKIECHNSLLSLPVLIEILNECKVSPEEFFYFSMENYPQDKEILNTFKDLSMENKKIIQELIHKLKK